MKYVFFKIFLKYLFFHVFHFLILEQQAHHFGDMFDTHTSYINLIHASVPISVNALLNSVADGNICTK